MFKVVTKLKQMKKALKLLNKEHFSDIEKQVNVAHQLMIECQEKIHRDIGNYELLNQEKEARLQ